MNRLLWAGHDLVRDRLWLGAGLLRRWRQPRPATGRRVMHVTASFDVGGTQMQIKHLCTAAGTRYQHLATELFPEHNYLYRAGETIDTSRYERGGMLARRAGRMIGSLSPRGSHLVQIRKLAVDFESAQPDVVVGWGHEICILTFAAAAFARVPKVIFNIRTLNPSFGWTGAQNAALLQAAHRRTAPVASQVVVNSTVLQRDYAEWAGIDPASIAVCANGIQVREADAAEIARQRATVRSSCGIASDAIVVCNVGRFSPEKGQRSMIEAAQISLQNKLPLVWLLAGDGVLLDEMKRYAADSGVSNIVFAGRVSDVNSLLAASDIFVMPSDYEGMPNAMMEAMAAGLPCVSTRLSGARDVAREGIEADYYDARDARALADRVFALATDPQRATAMGRAAATRIREFDVPRLVGTFESIVDRVQ